jgi:hypothetical protein
VARFGPSDTGMCSPRPTSSYDHHQLQQHVIGASVGSSELHPWANA